MTPSGFAIALLQFWVWSSFTSLIRLLVAEVIAPILIVRVDRFSVHVHVLRSSGGLFLLVLRLLVRIFLAFPGASKLEHLSGRW